MRPSDLADALARTVREFAYIPVTPEQAAREVGLDAGDLRRAFAASRDPILLMLRSRPRRPPRPMGILLRRSVGASGWCAVKGRRGTRRAAAM